MTTSAKVTVHLMRHGEVHNPDRIVYGRLPNYHLSEKGQQMVRMSAQEFARRRGEGANIVHLVCSPLTRTRESAEPITELLGLQAHPDARVVEADNYFEGLHVNRQELLNNPRHWTKLYNPLRPSWGEPYIVQVRRMAQAIKDAARTAYQPATIMTDKEIADKLHISLTTVITHRKNIMTKLNAHSLSDVIIYAKPMTNGQQTIYINYRDIYKDGEYSSLGLGWYLSDETVERIYLHELDNITPIYGQTEKKQLIRGGVVDMEYYLSKTWYHTGPSVSYKTETEIEALLAYWDQKLREVAWIDTYDDVEAYIDRHMIYQDSPEEASKHGFNTGILPRRLVIAYLRGQRDLAALADEWLYKKNYASINKQITIDNLAKTVPYLEKLCGQ